MDEQLEYLVTVAMLADHEYSRTLPPNVGQYPLQRERCAAIVKAVVDAAGQSWVSGHARLPDGTVQPVRYNYKPTSTLPGDAETCRAARQSIEDECTTHVANATEIANERERELIETRRELAEARAALERLREAIKADIDFHEWTYTAGSETIVGELVDRREAVVALQREALAATVEPEASAKR